MVDIVCINGQFYKPEEAKISVFDRGFLFGDAVYEVTRSYGRILFQLEPHVERLYRSAEMIGMDLVISQSECIEELYRIYKKVNKDDKYLRVQVTRGEGAIGMSSDLAQKRNWIVYIKDIDIVPQEQYLKGVAIVTTQRLRNSKDALDPNIKSGNYLNNVLAFQEASKAKAFESIMVNAKGFCTEGTTSNIFRVIKGKVQTPPDSFDLLRGITRKCLFEIAKKNNINMEEAEFTPAELEASDEVFLTSSTREVLPISRVNNKTLPVGPITQELGRLYKHLIGEYCEKAKSTHPWK